MEMNALDEIFSQDNEDQRNEAYSSDEHSSASILVSPNVWPERPDVFQFHAQSLLVKRDTRVQGLILGAGREILLTQSIQNRSSFCSLDK
jgi:hypothetical protein